MAIPKYKGERYSCITVIAAQRRVLKLVYGYLSKMEGQDTLRTDGKGLMTIAELLEHIDAARKLKPQFNHTQSKYPY